jgi:two-component system chemotaxis response regulator CheY
VSKTVLTIDDSRTMRDMLLMALESAGYRVIQAVDGIDGLETLAAEGADVVITDINMPRLDGFGFIEGVRSDPKHRSTPILVLTTESDAEKKTRARDAGATGWIVKPFDPVRLVDAVRRVAA